MPKAKSGNFTLHTIVKACPADKAAHRYLALQRSGQYSELRMIQRGKAKIDIVGYKWPDKGARRKLGIGRARVNPIALFTADQLRLLHEAYDEIKTAPPTAIYTFRRVFAKASDAAIRQLVAANIKFVSRMALNEMSRRGMVDENPDLKTLRHRVAKALDATLNLAVKDPSIQGTRDTLAAWLDGAIARRSKDVLAWTRYLEDRLKKNPSAKGAATPNQVKFGSRGHTKVGWINRETKGRYQITYKVGAQTRHVWRAKDKVKFVLTGKKGRVPNNCPKAANPPEVDIHAASEMFHQRAARFKSFKEDFTWPKKLPLIGPCTMIEYVSDKFDGKVRRYYHKFGKGTRVYFDPAHQKNGEAILIIRGPFEIKPEGITG